MFNNKINQLLYGAGSLFSVIPSTKCLDDYTSKIKSDRESLMSDMLSIRKDAIKAVNSITPSGKANGETKPKSDARRKK